MAKENTQIIDDFDDAKKQEAEKEIENKVGLANEKTFSIIEEFIAGGYEKNLANLICYLPKERQEQALNKLPENVRTNVMNILKEWGEKKNSNPEVLSAAGNVLKNADFYGSITANEILDTLDHISKFYLETQIQNLYKTNPLLALNLYYSIGRMDIICELDNRAIQKWLRDVNSQDLAVALKLCSEKTQNKIFSNMSKRAESMVKEDMEFMGPCRKSYILEKQDELLAIAKRLADNGDIIMPVSLSNVLSFLDELV